MSCVFRSLLPPIKCVCMYVSGVEKQHDTDSDVDSDTLDHDTDDWGSSPRSDDQFNEATNTYRSVHYSLSFHIFLLL